MVWELIVCNWPMGFGEDKYLKTLQGQLKRWPLSCTIALVYFKLFLQATFSRLQTDKNTKGYEIDSSLLLANFNETIDHLLIFIGSIGHNMNFYLRMTWVRRWLQLGSHYTLRVNWSSQYGLYLSQRVFDLNKLQQSTQWEDIKTDQWFWGRLLKTASAAVCINQTWSF